MRRDGVLQITLIYLEPQAVRLYEVYYAVVW